MLLPGRLVTLSYLLPILTCLQSAQVAILPGHSGSVLVHKAMDEEEEEEGEDKLSEKLIDRMASVLNTGQLRLQQLVGYNDAKEEIFFTAGDPALPPGAAHLYSLNLPPAHPIPSNSTHQLNSPLPVCITCNQNDPSCLSSRFTAAPKVIQALSKIYCSQGCPG